MKSKLTLTIEGGVTHRAKTLARRRGKSLSQLVQDLLVRETGEADPNTTKEAFSERWAGRMMLAEKEGSRYEKLASKYDLGSGE